MNGLKKLGIQIAKYISKKLKAMAKRNKKNKIQTNSLYGHFGQSMIPIERLTITHHTPNFRDQIRQEIDRNRRYSELTRGAHHVRQTRSYDGMELGVLNLGEAQPLFNLNEEGLIPNLGTMMDGIKRAQERTQHQAMLKAMCVEDRELYLKEVEEALNCEIEKIEPHHIEKEKKRLHDMIMLKGSGGFYEENARHYRVYDPQMADRVMIEGEHRLRAMQEFLITSPLPLITAVQEWKEDEFIGNDDKEKPSSIGI